MEQKSTLEWEKTPVGPRKILKVPDFQACIMDAKNKGQMLRCCFRFLSNVGALANSEDPNFKKKITPFLRDYVEK